MNNERLTGNNAVQKIFLMCTAEVVLRLERLGTTLHETVFPFRVLI